jgi:hypothetical protein
MSRYSGKDTCHSDCGGDEGNDARSECKCPLEGHKIGLVLINFQKDMPILKVDDWEISLFRSIFDGEDSSGILIYPRI